jgi:hypothetical protein
VNVVTTTTAAASTIITTTITAAADAAAFVAWCLNRVPWTLVLLLLCPLLFGLFT